MTERDPNQPSPPSASTSDAPTVAWTPPPSTSVDDATPAPAEPVLPPRRASRVRWGIALVVIALVVAAGAAGVMLLTGQQAPSRVVGYAPVDSVVYGELRLDLPGDQRAELGEFLSKFPGFADQSTLDVKLDEAFDRVVLAATNDEKTWTRDIKPWFGGELGLAVGDLPSADAPENARFLTILTVTDATKAQAWFDELAGSAEARTADEAGTALKLYGDGESGPVVAQAIHGARTMLVGDETSVRDAIDGGGDLDFAASEEYRAALREVDGDSLGHLFVDVDAYYDWITAQSEELAGEAMPFGDLTREFTPDWVLVRAQARGDAMAFEAVMPHLEISAADENRVSTLAAHVPPSTFVLSDSHDFGPTIIAMLDRFRAEPELAEAFEEVDQVLSFVGGQDGLLGWMGDVGFALARDGDGVHGGLLITPTDLDKANALLTNLRNLASLGGSSIGLTVRDEDYNGTTMTIIDVGDWRDLAGLAASMGGGAAAEEGLPEGRLEIAYAATEEIVVVGIGPSFVKAVIDAGAGDSLADDARFKAHLDRVGAEHTALQWIDVVAVRELIESLAGEAGGDLEAYERDIKPYLLPLDAMIGTTVVDGEVDHGTFVVTVK
jgi:Protein of unknown function (DUF3352)